MIIKTSCNSAKVSLSLTREKHVTSSLHHVGFLQIGVAYLLVRAL
jgi:hypothetical protein